MALLLIHYTERISRNTTQNSTGETEMAKIKLTFHEAVEYIWKNSKQIRDWYTTEHQFDLNNYTRSEYRTSGLGAPGDIISEIVVEVFGTG